MACCLTDTGSLRFLLDGEGINVNQTPSTLSLAGFTDSQNLYVDCFLPQRGASHGALPTAARSATVLHKTTAATAATASATAEEGQKQQQLPQLRQRQRQ